MRIEQKLKFAQALLMEVIVEIEEKELEFKKYPKELPSFDEMVAALAEIEI